MPDETQGDNWESKTFTQKLAAVMQKEVEALFRRYGLEMGNLNIVSVEDDEEQLGSSNETITFQITATTVECYPDRYRT